MLLPDLPEHILSGKPAHLNGDALVLREDLSVLADHGHENVRPMILRLLLHPVRQPCADLPAILCSGNDPDHSLYPLGVIMKPPDT